MIKKLFKHALGSDIAAFKTDLEDSVIQMQDIVKKFKTEVGEVTVLKGINTTFLPAEFVGVIGKSGSGKSTLVNMITGIDRPTSGEVCIGGTPVNRLSESQMARWRGLNLGIVFQFYQLLPVLTLLENVMMPMDLAEKIPAVERETRAMGLLKMVGLEKEADKMPSEVSGGQQQAAAIARAMANDPPFIIADEPTGNLDSKTAENIFQLFEEFVDKGKTIIMVTHDPNLAQRTTRTLLLCDGEVINPTVAAALPWISHQEMLRITHKLETIRFQPGELILQKDQRVDAFYMIAKGNVEVSLDSSVPALRLGPNQFFGQTALLNGRKSRGIAAVSSQEAVEIVSLPFDSFKTILGTSDYLRQTLLEKGVGSL